MAPRSAGRGRPVTLLAALLLVVAALFPATALAHAELESSDPADGAVVEGTPDAIVLTFTEDLDPSKSSAPLHDAGGTKLADAVVDGVTMTIDPPELEPGVYEVRWTSAASDGHLERGIIHFEVTPPPPSPTPTPTPAPSATPAPTPSPTASPSPVTSADTTPASSSTADILLPIIAAVVLIAGFGYWLLRRRSGAGGAP
jgi:methionine-rich copper-binding protein CopC